MDDPRPTARPSPAPPPPDQPPSRRARAWCGLAAGVALLARDWSPGWRCLVAFPVAALVGGLLGALPGPPARATTAPPQRIRVVCDSNYPPYSFRAADGKLQGILIDQWKLWEARTGIAVDWHGTDWADALARMKAGEFDVIACIAETPARREFLDFTPPFATIDVPIFFSRDISGITDLASLRGFPVAVKEGDQHIDRLQAEGVTTLIRFPNHAAIVQAAVERKIGVFVFGAPSAIYHLNKAGVSAEFRRTAPVFRDPVRRAVRKGDTAMLQRVMDGFAGVSAAELGRIDETWFGRAINPPPRYAGYAQRAAAIAGLVILGLVAWNWILKAKLRHGITALRESEQRFRQIAENTKNVCWLATADLSRMLYINPAYETVWGRSCDSLYGDPHSFFAAVHPEDRPAVLTTAARNPGHCDMEYRLVRPDGSIRWVHDRRFSIRDHAGRPYRRAGIAEDITDRKLASELVKQTDERIRQFINAVPMMAWSLKGDGTVDFVNQRWLDYSGLTLEEEIADPQRPIHPDDVPRVNAKWAVAIAAGQPFECEIRLRRADGQYRWCLVRTEPFRDATGTVVKWFGASVDIEERRDAEESLRQKQEQLRVLVDRLHHAREEEAKRIARELHDDLGQQLTALKLELDGLEAHAGLTAAQRARFEDMHGMVDRMVRVVQTLATELRHGHLDMLGLRAAIEWQVQEFARRSAITCRSTQLDEIEGLSDAQSMTVFRILQEALTNVIRHARADAVDVSLREQGGHVVLTVQDNGRGITAAEMNDRKAIGLLGMRERAEIVGGSVTIQGAPGRGTTVVVKVPLTPKEAAPA